MFQHPRARMQTSARLKAFKGEIGRGQKELLGIWSIAARRRRHTTHSQVKKKKKKKKSRRQQYRQ